MNILVCGASGFIGSYLTAHLLAKGHSLVCYTRNVRALRARFSKATILYTDFNKDVVPENWLPRLENIDVVINCAGILTKSHQQDIDAIHYHAPLALFKACKIKNIRRIVHLSALGVESELDIDYVTSKRRLDDALMALDINAVILRPSLIYAAGAYGGTSFMRALSALPIIPLIGKGDKRFQPLSMDNLLEVFDTFINNDVKGIVNVVGPERLSIKQIISNFRQWLGLSKAHFISTPSSLVKGVAKIGDWFGKGPVTTTSYKLLMQENIADDEPLKKHLNFAIKPMKEALNEIPCQVQDLQHARLYFMRPVAKICLVSLWFISGLLPLLFSFKSANQLILDLGFSNSTAPVITTLSCLWDIFMAIWLTFSKTIKFVSFAQLATIFGYTLIASVGLSHLWLNPLGPLLKNIPIMILILILLLMEER